MHFLNIQLHFDKLCISLFQLFSQFPSTDKNFQDVQIQMNNAAVSLNQAASNIVTASRGTPQQLANSSNEYSSSYHQFINSGLTMAGRVT